MLLRAGIFSPTMYRIGGAELVALNMAEVLKQHRYEVIVSSNKRLDKTKIKQFYGKNVHIDAQIVFPFHMFPAYNHYNIYTLALQSLILRLNCDILIDVYGITPFPWSDILYFQGSTILANSSSLNLRNSFFLPYFKFVKPFKNFHNKVILANSKFKADFLKDYFRQNGLTPALARIDILYPPVATRFFRPQGSDWNKPRKNLSITISRIAPGKKLEIIPHIASMSRNVFFIIVGSLYSRKTLHSILRLANRLGVRERVKVLTDVPQHELRALLWNSKVYLHTTRNEAFGISIIEGMSSGCTPIVHDSGGPTEFVPKSLRYKTVAEAATKIEEAVSGWTPSRAKAISEDAARFDENVFHEKFTSIINSYVEEGSSLKLLH